MTNLVRMLMVLAYASLLCVLGGLGLLVLSRYVTAREFPITGEVAARRSIHSNWGLDNTRGPSGIQAAEAWKITRGSKDVTVAVIDTGVDRDHPNLKGRVLEGFDFTTNTIAPIDDHGHGTHVAGIVSAVAPNVKILPVKYYLATQSGAMNLRNTVKAIYFAVNQGAQIINYSGGGPEFSEEEYVALKYAETKGVLVVAAAGNERSDDDKPENYYYPGAYRLTNMIVVAATDINNFKIRSSNWGKTKVDVAAPGENIYSSLPNGRFGYMTGTSQATAFVSGIAALMLSKNPKLTPAQVKAGIRASCDNMTNLESKVACGGRVNAFRAVSSAGGVK